jgi:hypothetical protein
MATNRRRPIHLSPPPKRPRTRHLGQSDRPQQCHWPDCPLSATGTTEGEFYCTPHFLKTLQRQWEGEAAPVPQQQPPLEPLSARLPQLDTGPLNGTGISNH